MPLEPVVPGSPHPEQQPERGPQEDPAQPVQQSVSASRPTVPLAGPAENPVPREQGGPEGQEQGRDQLFNRDWQAMPRGLGQEEGLGRRKEAAQAQQDPSPAFLGLTGRPEQHGQDGDRVPRRHHQTENLRALERCPGMEPDKKAEGDEGGSQRQEKSATRLGDPDTHANLHQPHKYPVIKRIEACVENHNSGGIGRCRMGRQRIRPASSRCAGPRCRQSGWSSAPAGSPRSAVPRPGPPGRGRPGCSPAGRRRRTRRR